MKKIICFLFIFLVSTVARADISVSPFYITFDTSSPHRTDVVRFSNIGHETKTYRIKVINYRQMEDGSYEEITKPIPGNPFADPYLNYAPHETTLKPGQSQTVRVQRKAMAAAPDGEYVSHLLMQEVPDNSDKPSPQPKKSKDGFFIDIKALYGVTIPIIIDKGDLTDKGQLGAIKLQKTETGPQLNVTVNRSGTRSFWGTIVVTDGYNEIGRVNNFKIFLTTPRRVMTIPLTQAPTSKTQIILKDARTDEVVTQKTFKP